MDRPSKPPPARPPAPAPTRPNRSTPGLEGRERIGRTGLPRGTEAEVAGVRARLPTPEEREQRRALVYQLLNSGADAATIRRACAERFDMRADLVDELVRKVKAERAEQFEADRGRYKSEQVARLQSDLVRMRAQERKPWGAIARHEQLLARVVGTIEPVGINITGTVSVREALVAVVQHLDTDAIDDIVTEQLELSARARAAALLAPAPTRTVIDAPIDDPSRRPS